MKKIFLYFLLITLFACADTKKSKKIDIISKPNEVSISQQKKETLRIIGNKIWIRETPQTGKVLFTLNDGITCTILEKGIKDTIRGNADFWYKIKTNNQIGWVFGSQTSYRSKIVTGNFEPFLQQFLLTTFFGKNTDSLMHYKSPLITNYIHPKIGFTRFHNPGITCVPQEYNVQNYHNKAYPEIKLPFYKFKNMTNGFCEESSSNDGIYYNMITSLPEYPFYSESDQEYKMTVIKISNNYKNTTIMEVKILYKKWIIKNFYFMKIDKKWHLVLIDDCDCSA